MGSKEPFIQALNRNIQSMFLWGCFRLWIQQLRSNPIDRPFLFYAVMVTFCRLISSPLRACHRLAKTVNPPASVERSPVFIIGHWRSGTTLLHNLMCRDPQFCFLNMMDAVAPEISIFRHGFFYDIMRYYTPEKRPMDNMPLSPELPQEDEFAMTNMSPASFYHAWIFPRNAAYYFSKYAVMESATPEERNLWKKTYARMLKNVCRGNKSRRLLLKNPVNTGRVKEILEMFPDAKFIYLFRNPFPVYSSTLNLYHNMLRFFQVQTISEKDVVTNIFSFYEKLLKKYHSEKHLIPPGQLVEIRFEDLESNPIDQLRHIYKKLGLQGYEKALPGFHAYIKTQAGYRKNRYSLPEEIRTRIARKWDFAFDRYGYKKTGH